MVWVRSPVYFYNRNGTYYFSRAVPSDLRHRFPKRKIEVSLRTKSESKAARSAAALSDRLERYWDSLRMEMIYSKELGLTVLPETRTVAVDSFSLTDALALYHRLKGTGKTSLFFESSERSIRYLIECLGHDSLTSLGVSDARRFRDYLFERRHVLIIREACLLLCKGRHQPCDQGTWSIDDQCLQRYLHPG